MHDGATTAHDEPSAGPRSDRRLATVRGLLAKAEATAFPDEAEAFFAKASELIARYAIDEAMLWANSDDGVRAEPEEARIVLHSPYIGQKAVLVSAVARAHGCVAVRLGTDPSTRTELVSVVGFPNELRWVETLVTSLLVQLTSAMLDRCPSGLTAAGSAGWRRSFIIGFADEVASRLEADRAASRAAADHAGSGQGRSAALVLADRDAEVGRELRRRYPRLRTSWTSRGDSRVGAAEGRRAGREASLQRGGLGGRRAIGPGRG
jgi:hypothetical protein